MSIGSLTKLDDRLSWLSKDNVRPYVLLRKESRLKDPGKNFDLNWFSHKPLYMDPLLINDVYFADALLNMETRAFEHSDMAMPRWVFYDCGVLPGLITGFALRTETLPQSIRTILGNENLKGEWTPVSMFIIIPTMVKGEWVAHNLSSINSMIPKEDRMHGLGFLSKAFGLAYGNINVCVGMTQWHSPALRLHSYYGNMEILTAYTPAHTYANTITYRVSVDPEHWKCFFTGDSPGDFEDKFVKTDYILDPYDEASQVSLHRRIEYCEGPFYLSSKQIKGNKPGSKLSIYKKL
ncbi:hypothetical protein N9W41_01690 [bacterium]|nr:hypothetical protein [bacterium]